MIGLGFGKDQDEHTMLGHTVYNSPHEEWIYSHCAKVLGMVEDWHQLCSFVLHGIHELYTKAIEKFSEPW